MVNLGTLAKSKANSRPGSPSTRMDKPFGASNHSFIPLMERHPRRSAMSKALRVSKCQSCGASALSSTGWSGALSARGSSSSLKSHATTIDASTANRSWAMPLMAPSQGFFGGESHGLQAGAALPERFHRPFPTGAIPCAGRSWMRNPFAMPSDGNGFFVVHRPKEFELPRLGFSGSDLTHPLLGRGGSP